MAQVLRHLPKTYDNDLLVGLDTSDDAAVYRLNEETAIIQTLDFLTPVVDDPYIFGQIAAANSLSDIYAMGGDPKLAMNIVCFPDCLEPQVLEEILKGGYDKVREAGAILVGGHSVSDDEPKYGLSVTGFTHPNKILTNSNAKAGDLIILTKPLGLGIVNTAIKGDIANDDSFKEAVKIMTSLNKYAKEAMDKIGRINSVTDITGFGLLGHALEMAEGSQVSIIINSSKVPYIKEAYEYADMGLVPAGAYSNKNHIGEKVIFKEIVTSTMRDILYDPQTSGGLLISVAREFADSLLEALIRTPNKYAIIGQVVEKQDNYIFVE